MAQTDPVVTVVLPAFNAAATIGGTIRSVLAQSFPDFELIICDDGSTIEMATALAGFQDPRIRLIRNDANLGPGPSRDRAIDMARGRWIAFIDADDAWDPARLETLLALAAGEPNALVFDDLLLCQQRGPQLVPWKRMGRRGDFPVKPGGSVEISLSAYLLSRSLLIKPMVPISAIQTTRVSHSARRYGEDAEYFIRLMHSGLRAVYVDVALYQYRLAPGSLSTQVSRGKEMMELLEALGAQLGFAGEAAVALERKLARLARKAAYDRYLADVRKSGFLASLGRLGRQPQLLVEFARRLPQATMGKLRSMLYGTSNR